jgi:hypothetical protein
MASAQWVRRPPCQMETTQETRIGMTADCGPAPRFRRLMAGEHKHGLYTWWRPLAITPLSLWRTVRDDPGGVP